MRTRLLAIDPGKGGGLAWRDADGVAHAERMPDGMTAQYDRLWELRAELGAGLRATVEKVGYHMPGNSGTATATFARHVGHLEAGLYALAVPVEQVAPGVWMRALGKLPKDKTARKRAIRERMQRRFPALRVTLATADALGMLVWAETKRGGGA